MDHELKKKIQRRLKIIQGQIKGLSKMIDEEKYCIDILIQSMAIKKALSSIEDLVLQNHLKTHVKEQFITKKDKKAVEELMKIFKLAKRK